MTGKTEKEMSYLTEASQPFSDGEYLMFSAPKFKRWAIDQKIDAGKGSDTRKLRAVGATTSKLNVIRQDSSRTARYYYRIHRDVLSGILKGGQS